MKKLLLAFAILLGMNQAKASVTLPFTAVTGQSITAAGANADWGALRDELNLHESTANAHNTRLQDILATNNSCGPSSINFNLNPALSFRVENLASDPVCNNLNAGQLEWNTTSSLFKICNGTSFVSIAGSGVNTLSSVLNASNSAGAFNIDLNENQLLNGRVENRTSDPSPGNAGRLFYRTDTSALKVDTGAAIATIGGSQGLSSVLGISNSAGATNLDMNGNQILNQRWESLASDPGTTSLGRVYFNSGSGKPRFYNGSSWSDVGNTNTLAATLLLGNSVGSTDVNFNSHQAQNLRIHNLAAPPGTGTPGVIWYDTGSSQIGFETSTSNRVVSTLDDSQTLTNKTISGASNTLTNIPDTALSANVGLLNGNQTVSGTKTFSAAPVVSNIKTTAGTTNGHTIPNGLADDTFVLANAVQTLSGKTLNAPTLSGNLDASEFQLKNLRIDNVTSTPAFGNAGRIIYKTTTGELQFDTGSSWQTVGTATGPGLATVLGINNSAGALNINMNENQLLAARIENLASDPATGNIGRMYYNTSTNQIKVDNGAAWVVVSGAVTPTLAAILTAGNSAGATNINVNENQLLASRLENLGSAPATGNTGRVYWNTANNDIEADTGAAIKQIADLNSTQTLTNKTLTTPVISSILSGGQTVTVPAATDQLVGRATTDTLTNKTMAFGSNTFTGQLGIGNGGTGAATASAAFNALSPMTTLGDLTYGAASGAGTRLAGNTTAVKQFLSQTGTGAVSAAPVWGALVSADIPALDFSKITTGTVPLAQGGTGQITANAGLNALLPTQTGNAGKVLKTDGTNTSWISAGSVPVAPTVQALLSGSGTYTTPAGTLYIRVIMVGGGGGGSGSGTTSVGSGGAGGNSTFGTTLLVANGGSGGSVGVSGNGGAGGTASLGTGPIGMAIAGARGFPGLFGVVQGAGGSGSATPLGGAGSGGIDTEAYGGGFGAGNAAVTNSGSGGGGGSGGTSFNGGSGGGAGGFVRAIITAPSATYAYAVGAAGTAGTAGTSGVAGGAGGSGSIIVEEYYQ